MMVVSPSYTQYWYNGHKKNILPNSLLTAHRTRYHCFNSATWQTKTKSLPLDISTVIKIRVGGWSSKVRAPKRTGSHDTHIWVQKTHSLWLLIILSSLRALSFLPRLLNPSFKKMCISSIMKPIKIISASPNRSQNEQRQHFLLTIQPTLTWGNYLFVKLNKPRKNLSYSGNTCSRQYYPFSFTSGIKQGIYRKHKTLL